MDIDITEFYNNESPRDYSASIAELGRNAGKITWQAAIESEHRFFSTEKERETVRDYFKSFGAWDDAEVASWSDVELNALLVQCISGDIRDSMALSHDQQAFDAYYEESLAGQVSGRIWCSDDDGKVYYYVGE